MDFDALEEAFSRPAPENLRALALQHFASASNLPEPEDTPHVLLIECHIYDGLRLFVAPVKALPPAVAASLETAHGRTFHDGGDFDRASDLIATLHVLAALSSAPLAHFYDGWHAELEAWGEPPTAQHFAESLGSLTPYTVTQDADLNRNLVRAVFLRHAC